jgi:hypothetical protein
MKVATSLGATMMSDGWKDAAARNFLNVLIVNPTGRYFLITVDVKGQTKDAKFISDFMIKAIEDVQVDIGKCNVTAVVMDGACESFFVPIEAKIPTITCFICPAHSIDSFLKNVCGCKAEVTVRGEATFEWGEKLFSDTIAATWSVVHFITSHQKTLAIYVGSKTSLARIANLNCSARVRPGMLRTS